MDSEQLRHELAQLRAAQQEGERKQGLREAEAESACGGGRAGPGPLAGCPAVLGGHGLPSRLQRRPVPRRHATPS